MNFHRGLTVGNSAIASEVGNGFLFNNVRVNPPSFEQEKNRITPVGNVSLTVSKNGNNIPYTMEITENTYPIFRGVLYFENGVSASFVSFAPITAGKSLDMFLPFIIMRWSFSCGDSSNMTFELTFDADSGFVRIGDAFGIGSVKKTITAEKGTEIVALFGVFYEDSPWKNEFATAEELSLYGIGEFDRLFCGIEKFIGEIPAFGDGKVNEYIRWYTQAAVMLTKADKSGKVITMGYNELNQRDSFWTTFMHLMCFPDLERRMIEISAEYQSGSGKIPTTILPLIEREFDIDINEYFCLRISRYYRYHKDREFLKKLFPHYKKSVEFLLSRDRDGDFLPEQEPPENPECYWGDWKDVSYIMGRKLAPHFSLLWLAVLKDGAYLARETGEYECAVRYEEIYDAAYERINRPWNGTGDGGLWAGECYNEVWYDGKKRDFILEDQTVGMLFDVVPAERAEKIYSALKENECLCGIRETYPYRTGDDVWNRGGTYHNGGVWPWLIFCDLAGRYKAGRCDEVLSFIRTLGYHDLEKPGDFRPNEYLDGESGENCGMEVQGWSSAVWAVEYVKRIYKIQE